MLPAEITRLLALQDGVISRRQAMAAGLTKSDLDRLVRHRELTRMMPGVFVDHTGEPTWLQRAWAGVLFYDPAALADASAVRATGGLGGRSEGHHASVWIAVADHRHVQERAGYRIRYLTRFDDQVLSQTRPPRMRYEDACLDLVARTSSRLDRIQIMAGACQARRTTADRLLGALRRRSRMPDRRWVERVLHDIAAGTCSVLEHGYLTLVERAHGLPRGQRQLVGEDSSGRVYRDVHYPGLDQYVELDGLLVHGTPEARDADLERDLDAAVSRHGTVRLGWGQVYGRPCRTAAKVASLLTHRGWTGTLRPCGADCRALSA